MTQSSLTPNRALARARLEALAWQASPAEARDTRNGHRCVLMGTSDGTTRVELSSLTDNQLRKYIGPRALEEAGDMAKNGSDSVEAFKDALLGELDIGDRQIFFRDGAYGRVFINFYNVPLPHRGASPEGENNRLMLDVVGLESAAGKIRVELAVRGPSFGDDYKLRAKTTTAAGAVKYIADYLNRAAKKAPYGFTFDRLREEGKLSKNARREAADEQAARELSLYIENEYSLVGAEHSQGKAIEKNLLNKIKKGAFSRKLSEQLWMYLIESGARKYAKEFATEQEWSKMFSKPTRELVAHEFAVTFYEENKAAIDAAEEDAEEEGEALRSDVEIWKAISRDQWITDVEYARALELADMGLINKAGDWKLTQAGRKALGLAQNPSPSELDDIIDRDQIPPFREQARAAGALDWVARCDRALEGSVPDWNLCADAICGLEWPWDK